jgi:hypothetical protein
VGCLEQQGRPAWGLSLGPGYLGYRHFMKWQRGRYSKNPRILMGEEGLDFEMLGRDGGLEVEGTRYRT